MHVYELNGGGSAAGSSHDDGTTTRVPWGKCAECKTQRPSAVIWTTVPSKPTSGPRTTRTSSSAGKGASRARLMNIATPRGGRSIRHFGRESPVAVIAVARSGRRRLLLGKSLLCFCQVRADRQLPIVELRHDGSRRQRPQKSQNRGINVGRGCGNHGEACEKANGQSTSVPRASNAFGMPRSRRPPVKRADEQQGCPSARVTSAKNPSANRGMVTRVPSLASDGQRPTQRGPSHRVPTARPDRALVSARSPWRRWRSLRSIP